MVTLKNPAINVKSYAKNNKSSSFVSSRLQPDFKLRLNTPYYIYAREDLRTVILGQRIFPVGI